MRLLSTKRELKKYSDLNDKLSKIGINYPDNYIILDAHDLSLNDGICLNFISVDKKMIERLFDKVH